jgi:HlyD family secretion protein
MRVTKRRTTLLLLVLAGAGLLIALAFRPKAINAEVVAARVSPMMVTIDDDGMTRVIERYVVASPVAGRHARVEVHAGDAVRAGDVMVRVNPAPLDARQVAEITARLNAAQERLREAQATEARARIAMQQAARDRKRGESLNASGIAAARDLEQWRTAENDARRDHDAAVFRTRAAAFDVETIRAGLEASVAAEPLLLHAPVAGRVLRVTDESETVVPAGRVVMEIGDPSQLEIVADILSSDAVKVRAGQDVLVHGWGGDQPLHATVTRVEPSAFTKISALGVEEQRVNVLARIIDPPPQLGDQFRVDVSIVLWSGSALNVPNTTLFHAGDRWALFVVRDGRARLQPVAIGHRGSMQTEIASGIRNGDAVIAYPSDQLRDGVRVRQ